MLELAHHVQVQMVAFDADPARGVGQHGLQCGKIVVALPVGVDDVLAEAAAPRHSGVDVRGDTDRLRRRNDKRVLPTERRVEEIRVVLDAVVAREDDGIEVLRGHDLAQTSEATLELRVRKGERHLLTVVEGLETLQLGDIRDIHLNSNQVQLVRRDLKEEIRLGPE